MIFGGNNTYDDSDQNKHPHIVRLEGVCGGEPVIDGLRVHSATRRNAASAG